MQRCLHLVAVLNSFSDHLERSQWVRQAARLKAAQTLPQRTAGGVPQRPRAWQTTDETGGNDVQRAAAAAERPKGGGLCTCGRPLLCSRPCGLPSSLTPCAQPSPALLSWYCRPSRCVAELHSAAACGKGRGAGPALQRAESPCVCLHHCRPRQPSSLCKLPACMLFQAPCLPSGFF